MSTPKTIKAEYDRATAAELAIQGANVDPAVNLGTIAGRLVALEKATAPIPPATTGKVAKTIADLKALLLDDTVSAIVGVPGTVWSVGQAYDDVAASLHIGAKYAGRTTPVLVDGTGVTLDGGGATHATALAFLEGAHDQTWIGFAGRNGDVTQDGWITFGRSGSSAVHACHDILLQRFSHDRSIKGPAVPGSTGNATAHSVYFSESIEGDHNITVEDFSGDGSGGLASAIHFDHPDSPTSALLNAHDVVIRRLVARGYTQAILIWEPTVRRVLFETALITGASPYGARTRGTKAGSNIEFRDVVSNAPFFSDQGAAPLGVIFTGTTKFG